MSDTTPGGRRHGMKATSNPKTSGRQRCSGKRWGILALLGMGLSAIECVKGIAYNATLDPWNLNKNQDPKAAVLDYYTQRTNKTYTPSPDNWRALPTYTLLLDKWIDEAPNNNDFFESMFEYDTDETQLRYGGDANGLASDRSLDYLVGMGVKCIYIAGTPWLNMPWGSDGYSALDFILLDPHYGTLAEWVNAINKLHARGIYIIMDFTVGTMGDLIGFKGYLNSSTPFSLAEHDAEWKLPPYVPWGIEKYPDFTFNNVRNASCTFPVFWLDDGTIVDVPSQGCYASEFDQYGDIEAFGVFPDWERQLAKFASVQDRLRDWNPEVRTKLEHLACMAIEALDIDGARIDKATQLTVESMAVWANATRACAKTFQKNNFFIPGEITGGDTFGALYIGRGRTPQQLPPGFLNATTLTPDQSQYFLREEGMVGLDSAAFHYSIYRSLTRWLGMDGNLVAAYDLSTNFVTAWNEMVVSNDFLNSQTGAFDPRHMFGATNQDVFRWPALTNGTLKNAVGNFITTLVMPGIPLLYYGEEQALYILDNGASNYLYGRQGMTGTKAWQRHGCYKLGSGQYFNMPLDQALTGCDDDAAALDHFDPTNEARRLMAVMYHLRANYPALQDGLNLVQLGNWTHYIQLPGSNVTQTELGMWSTERAALPAQVNNTEFLNKAKADNVWLLYSNENATQTYTYPCTSENWISSPYLAGTAVQNLFYPYEQYTLQASLDPYYYNGLAPYRGCLPSVTIAPFGFKALVPVAIWAQNPPMMTKFSPGHDARLLSDGSNTIQISFEYDVEMNCQSLTNALKINYSLGNSTLKPTFGTPTCTVITNQPAPYLSGVPPSGWRYTVTVNNAPDGVYEFVVGSVNAQSGNATTGTTDHLLVRKGTADNVMVFPDADYSTSVLSQSGKTYTINHNAPGADSFRYSGDFRQSWSAWQPYESATTVNSTAFSKTWWQGQHIIVQYWSAITGSSSPILHGDVGFTGERRFPQVLARGVFNQWGYDSGADANLQNLAPGEWSIALGARWPASVQLNVFGYDDYFYGDTDGDNVIDRLPPNAQSPNYLNMSTPPLPHLSWTLTVNDATGEWSVAPRGHYMVGIILFALLLAIPLITSLAAAMVFRYSFYAIKVNKWGIKPTKETNYFPIGDKKAATSLNEKSGVIAVSEKAGKAAAIPDRIIGWPEDVNKRRKVLIATLEYEILDWKLKVKIGGLGVMSTLMGKAMTDVDLIWVVPKVKDLEYPQGEYAEPIEVVIFGEPYLIEVEIHQLDHITYFILDSPVFRAQTKSDPYPQRMDDLSSAIFYSTWNQAIAEAIRRYPVIDIYHINDYHGALAPLYLLPKILPVCLSLHNAEFQGLWPLRTKDEMKEVCAAFNIPKEICSKYVQFGNTFNLLHAAASFISHHQKSVGVAGVSDKYGKRSWARYPALWTLRTIDSLPNPDPTDIAALDAQPIAVEKIEVDDAAESQRPENKRQAQEWAGIAQNPDADLFVFVGRWSKQKGVDLIADVMPSIMDKKPNVQLICVGPVIDLYGRFAAEKLARLMEIYPDRVFSKPEFTSLPPYLFSGADFALIPSRDEPFGLVAVEFGRKGALGVGARLGGLGLMPGWWFPVESNATVHMLSQLTKTIKLALKSTQEERAILRARSAVQRFPVVEWRQRLEDFQRRSITISRASAGENAMYYDSSPTPGQAAGFYAQQHGSTMSVNQLGQGYNQTPPDSPQMSHRGSLDERHMATPSPLGSPLTPGHHGNPGFEGNPPMGNPAMPIQNNGALYHRRFENNGNLAAPDDEDTRRRSARSSGESFYDEDPNNPNRRSQNAPTYYDDGADPNQARHLAPSKAPKFYVRGADNYSPHGDNIYEDDEGSDRYPSGQSSDMGDSSTADHRAARPTTGHAYDNFLAAANRQIAKQSKGTRDPFIEHRQSIDSLNGGIPNRPFTSHSRASSFDSISSIMDEKGGSSPLNKAIVDFTDSDGEVAQSFVQKLQNLSADNSKGDLCIEKYLMKSEKAFFSEVKKERMSSMMSVKSSRDSFIQSRPASMIDGYRPDFDQLPTAPYSMGTHETHGNGYGGEHRDEDHAPENEMTRLQIFMQKTVAGWPLYTVVISIGQLLSATSFQLTLLTGSNTQTAIDLYIIGSIFFVSTLCWYTLFRLRPSVWVLSLPWIFYAIAFFLIGIPSLHGIFTPPQQTITAVATWVYAVASSAGFLFFGLNFGEEAGAATEVWILRACIVQGLQQIWVSVLWYWGATLNGTNPDLYVSPVYVIYATWPLALMSLLFAYVMFCGLPDYYRQIPPYVPNFFKTLFRRKLVIWFLIAEILRDYWLSGPYGRNWTFLWNNAQVPPWAIVIMIAVFFVGVWGAIMAVLIRYSKVHSWLMPIFAIGLGCPRWCQMLWGTSGIALYLPWGGVVGPYIGTSMWLWLGVLDSIQGVGLGMILLQTLSRLHVCATLALAQMLGASIVMLARGTAPDKVGPGNVFPNIALWDLAGDAGGKSHNPLGYWEFWVALACQIIIVIGYFIFFRREQLSKP